MEQNRRTFLRLAVGAGLTPLLAACATSHQPRTTGRPVMIPPEPTDGFELPPEVRDWTPRGGTLAGAVGAIPRSRWAQADPIASRMNKLGSVQRITVHHEGMTRVEFTGISQVADRLDLVRRSHLQRMAAGDIGYHFVIDRAGRIWEGRPIEYQGAHVKYHNRRNLGVMVMGNFDVQSPSDAQMTSLEMFLRTARTHYDVAIDDVFTHQELGPTACPGRSLQRHMVEIRRDGTLA